MALKRRATELSLHVYHYAVYVRRLAYLSADGGLLLDAVVLFANVMAPDAAGGAHGIVVGGALPPYRWLSSYCAAFL
jgi:hypothetical protein